MLSSAIPSSRHPVMLQTAYSPAAACRHERCSIADARPICACNSAKAQPIQAKLCTTVAPALAGAYRQRVFLTLMVIGLVGLAAMAIPAFGHTRGVLSGHAAHGI